MTKKIETTSGGTKISKRWAMLDQLYRSTRRLRLTYQLDTNKLNATCYFTSIWGKTSDERRD